MTSDAHQAALNRTAARRAFVERRRHELAGLVLDGGTIHRAGPEFALWARTIMYRTDAMLGQMFDDLIPEIPVPLSPEAKAKIEAEAKKVAEGRQPPKK